MEFICRRLTEKDISMVMKMNVNFREGFAALHSAAMFLSDPRNWMFAAVSQGVIVGFAYGYALNRLDGNEKMLYINEVGVMPRYQRQGVGYRLLSELKTACNESGISKYFLSAYQNNIGACALYRKLGGAVAPESQGNDINFYFSTK